MTLLQAILKLESTRRINPARLTEISEAPSTNMVITDVIDMQTKMFCFQLVLSFRNMLAIIFARIGMMAKMIPLSTEVEKPGRSPAAP